MLRFLISDICVRHTCFLIVLAFCRYFCIYVCILYYILCSMFIYLPSWLINISIICTNFLPLYALYAVGSWHIPSCVPHFEFFCRFSCLYCFVLEVDSIYCMWIMENKIKVMTSEEWQKIIQRAAKWPCGVCGRGVGNNSIQHWSHLYAEVSWIQ